MTEKSSSSSSYDSDYFDIDQMKKDFEKAVEADARYWRENDAKFRAINQKVASYDEFKDIVLASHLKPLEKSDKIKTEFQQPWNILANERKSEQNQNSSKKTQTSKKDEMKIPKSSNEFVVEWRRLKDSSEKQCEFLFALGVEKLSEFFKYEVAHGLLGEIIKVLHSHETNLNPEEVLAVLEALSTSGRFSLSLLFFSVEEKQVCRKLFKKLKNDFLDSNDSGLRQNFEELEKKYSNILK